MIGKIKSVEFVDDVDFVYDLSVEDNHNFIANDIVVSNCHHIPASQCSEVSRWCKDAYYRIGVSATPWRDSGDELMIEATLAKRKPENDINASKLIDGGYLVPCTIHFVKINQQFKGKNYHQVYNNAIVNNLERNENIVTIAKKMYDKDKKTLILIKNIEHGEKLLDMLQKIIEPKFSIINVNNKDKEVAVKVNNIEFLSGKDDALRRRAVLQGVKDGLVDILIGSTIADEGLTLAPHISNYMLQTV